MVSYLRRRLPELRDHVRAHAKRGGLAFLNHSGRLLRGRHPKVSEERLKLGASGLQNAALTMAVAVFVTPHLNTSFVVTIPWLYGTGFGAIMLILASQRILDYIPDPRDQKETTK